MNDLKIQPIGIARPVDEIGRVTIPKDIRESLSVKSGDKMNFFRVEGGILLVKNTEEKGE